MAKPLRFSNDGAELSFELAARSKKVPSTICKLGTQAGDSHFPAKLGPSPGAAQAGDSHFPAKLQAGCGVLQAGPSWGPKLGTATFQPSWSCKLGTATFRLQAGETASWGRPGRPQAGDSHFPAKLGPSPGAGAGWGQPLSGKLGTATFRASLGGQNKAQQIHEPIAVVCHVARCARRELRDISMTVGLSAAAIAVAVRNFLPEDA